MPAVVLWLTALLAPGALRAAEQPLLNGRRARFHAAPFAPRARIEFRGDAGLSSLGDPRCPAVSRLRLTTSVAQFTQIDLPCQNWRQVTGGYLYVDFAGIAGGVRRLLLRSDRLVLRMDGAHYTPVSAPIPFAEATIAVGGNSACGRFSAFRFNSPGHVVAAAGSEACHPRPNFLIVNLDDSRADGIDRMPTVLSRLAAEGISFTNSFVVEALCAPSRASLLTGSSARRHGVRAVAGDIGGAHVFRENGADQQTIATWLRAAAYETGLFGKYINAYSATEQTAGPNGTFYVPPGWSRWRAMMSNEHYGGILGQTYSVVDELGGVTTYDDHTTDEQYSTDLLAVEARAFVTETVSAGRNFFVYYAPYASHSDTPELVPYPAARHSGTFTTLLPPWRPPSWNEGDVSDKPLWVQSTPLVEPIPAAVNDLIRDLAYESLLSVDEQIGLFLEQFEALGVADDTVIIFTSDNGVTWGEHRFFGQGKQCPYNECLRVPLIVRYPRFATPAVREAPVLNIDIAPTIVALSGVQSPGTVDGTSFAGWILDDPPQPRDDFLFANWRGTYNDRLDYTGQPTDGDQIRVLYGASRPQPRPAVLFEFDDGSGLMTPGAVPVAIGANADVTFSNLGNAIAAAVPFTSKFLNAPQNRLTMVDLTPDHTGVYFLIERDQNSAIQHEYPLPDYFGVRDVTNGFTYVEHETGEVELYDQVADPYELENVAADPRYAAERSRLAQRLADLLAAGASP